MPSTAKNPHAQTVVGGATTLYFYDPNGKLLEDHIIIRYLPHEKMLEMTA